MRRRGGERYILKDNTTHPRDISAVYQEKKIILSQFSMVLTMVICITLRTTQFLTLCLLSGIPAKNTNMLSL
jgi:hypothetical protein